uniref:Pentatricopeptide repeat-containing protein At1g06270 n=1 Tax=Anthurium amnicola TaxID=1678845 RepID=A0A1D1YBI0_9ARAE
MGAAVAPWKQALHLLSCLGCRHHLHRRSSSLQTPVQVSIRTAIETGNHREIPHILSSSSSPDDNPFAFLSGLPPALTARVVDDVLQSLLPLRPRSLPHPAYAALLSLFLPGGSNSGLGGYLCVSLPLALAVLQTGVRSGYSPPPCTRPSLSRCWVHLRRRHHRQPASRLLSSMRGVGYRPDVRTCNYLISSLCSSSEADEAIRVLRGMGGAGCVPDSESYCTVIEACCAPEGKGGSATLGVPVAVELLREMVAGEGMVPRKGTVGMLVAAMRREGQARRAAEVVRFLEREGFSVGFEEYESSVEGCLEGGEFVMAGKVVVEMAQRGFIPYIKARQRVVEELAGIGQHELASAVRQTLAEIKS